MSEIIPTIIAKDFSEVKEKMRQAEKYFQWVQLDIMDGVFVPNKTWQQASDLKDLKTSLKLEAHLMVADPGEQLSDWLSAGAQRIIIHWEALPVGTGRDLSLPEILTKAKVQKKEFGLALNPETPVDVLRYWLDKIDLVLIMTVNPGQAGQKFLPQVLPKIQELRQLWPSGKISVDGGINPETGQACVLAGANILSVGSYLWLAPDIKTALLSLRGARTQ